LKSIFRISPWIGLLLIVGSLSAQTSEPLASHRQGKDDAKRIRVVYPKPGQRIGAVDTTFILGHLPDLSPLKPEDLVLVVNDSSTFPIHASGGFLAWVPIAPGEFTFRLRAFPKDLIDSLRTPAVAVAAGSLAVVVPQPLKSARTDSLEIPGDYRPPMGDLVLSAGETLQFSCQASPDMIAWASIPGLADSIPMTETDPRPQPFWGENVFGAGAVPESLLIRGIYTGEINIPDSARVIDQRITYHIALPESVIAVLRSLLGIAPPDSIDNRFFMSLTARDTAQSRYRISANHPEYPFTVRFSDSMQILRHGPLRGYFATFQPAGIEASVVGTEGDWFKLRLSETQYAWAAKRSVTVLPRGSIPPKSLLKVVRMYSEPDRVRIECALSGKHAFQVFEDNQRTIRVRLFGVTSDTDWIRYDFSDSLIDLATWNQPEPGVYEMVFRLTQDIWGYDAYYEGNSFYVQLNRPPVRVHSIKGKRIVIDPGHSADPGSIGPTGYTEAEANLGIAKTVAYILRRRGAEVIMTREDTSHVALYDRPALAKSADADLFVSIHNNALPDGVNPFVNNGTSSYYYHPHSMPLAREIHRRMIGATGLSDHGFYHGNLAVQRPTQYPAVLVECAFMILPEQEALLQTKRFRISVARAIADGIEAFLKGYDRD
jgi:N-acetylmuramoyl-L-alanine amidase